MNVITSESEFTQAARLGIENTPWGYIIRCKGCDRNMAIVRQGLAGAVGVALLMGAIGLWLMPGSLLTADLIAIKIAMSGFMGLITIALLWFALHGTYAELQVDRNRRELRQVLRSKRGRAKVQDQIGFEDIGSVYIDRLEVKKGKTRLLLRLGNLRQVIIVAIDHEENLTALRDLMGSDILGQSSGHRPLRRRGFLFPEARGVVQPELAA